ncbi:type VII secretion-associated serine protease mycosin [Corynebacterium crudilactis]|uniref:Type VII secretion-associated serine protease mycosin n=1 Tax=Corynebacterium crudilactis TaxID=1652495 RepID=A0A172QRE7_9CORY|nr:type VII secretion-associated serine protease mycosin [Corynebacterium crudilactis]ANE03267.1 type VII secretion-associated serine protease mycosin [Corynebacterium crudilactis]
MRRILTFGLALCALIATTPAAFSQEVEALACPDVAIADSSIATMDEHLTQSLQQAHRIATGAGTMVAVIDTGVSPHPRLPHLVPGGDFVGAHQSPDMPGELIDCDGHGTIVAGIIAAQNNSGSGWPYDGTADSYLGVAPDAGIISIKQTSSYIRTHENSTIGTLSTLADSIHRALDAGAHVINISVVSCLSDVPEDVNGFQPLTDALNRAELHGTIVVAAAGNLGQNCPADSTVYPAHSDTVLSVSARFDSHTLADYSMPGDQQLLSAPSQIPAGLSPRGDGFASHMITTSGDSPFAGTSFAAPVVSATAALLRQHFPFATPQEIRLRIFNSIDPARGAIDPYLALTQEIYPADPVIHEIALSIPDTSDQSPRQRSLAVLVMICGALGLLAIVVGIRHRQRRGF